MVVALVGGAGATATCSLCFTIGTSGLGSSLCALGTWLHGLGGFCLAILASDLGSGLCALVAWLHGIGGFCLAILACGLGSGLCALVAWLRGLSAAICTSSLGSSLCALIACLNGLICALAGAALARIACTCGCRHGDGFFRATVFRRSCFGAVRRRDTHRSERYETHAHS